MDKKEQEAMAKVFHGIGRTVYEDMGYNQFAPVLCVFPKDSDKAIIGTLPTVSPGNMYAVVQRVVLALEQEPSIIAITTDAYAFILGKDATDEEKEAMLAERKKKTFAQMFEENDPRVKESLNTVVLSEECNLSIAQSYMYTPVDGFEWGEEMVCDGVDWDFDRLINGKPKLDMHGRPICPICGHYVPNDATPGEYPGALSRRDNKTEICSDCGTREAFEDFARARGEGLI
jgi:hypothetical protein